MSGGTEIKSLEQRIASIEKRNAARDEYIEWVNGDDGPLEGTMARAKWAAIKARHGLSPTPGAETVPPPAGKERWFMNDKGFVREYPSGRWWYEDGTAAQSTTIATMAQCIADGDTELDGPPPHGKPLAAQGKGMPPDRSIEDRATAAWSTPEYRHLTGPAAMAKFAQTETARLRQQLSDVTGEREAYRTAAMKLEAEAAKAAEMDAIKDIAIAALKLEIRTLAKQVKKRPGKGAGTRRGVGR